MQSNAFMSKILFGEAIGMTEFDLSSPSEKFISKIFYAFTVFYGMAGKLPIPGVFNFSALE